MALVRSGRWVWLFGAWGSFPGQSLKAYVGWLTLDRRFSMCLTVHYRIHARKLTNAVIIYVFQGQTWCTQAQDRYASFAVWLKDKAWTGFAVWPLCRLGFFVFVLFWVYLQRNVFSKLPPLWTPMFHSLSTDSQVGVEPTVISYTTVLNAYAKQGNIEATGD